MKDGKRIGGIIMAAVGGVTLVVGLIIMIVFLSLSGELQRDYIREMEVMYEDASDFVCVIGTVYDIDKDGYDGMTTVAYNVDGETYYSTFEIYNNRYKIKDSLKVYYHPDYPSFCLAPELYESALSNVLLFLRLYIFFGVFASVVGIGMLTGGIVLLMKKNTLV